MASRFEKRIAAAKELQERLSSEGRPADAEVLRALRMSANTCRNDLVVLHRDVMELRARVNELEGGS